MSVIQLRLHGAAGARSRHRPLGETVGRLFGRVVATVREWQRRSHDRETLAGFDERMLRDIGLSPAEAEFIVNKPFWRE
jgi:uncharacterized protein YjiS (DUF1127 family)